MIEAERLLELTEGYLKSLVCEVSSSLSADFDPLTPFGELGVDSFRVLKIIKALEADFGVLPKTLLFENFNVRDLAGYFVRKHARTLSEKFASELQQQAPRRNVVPVETSIQQPVVSAAQARVEARPILLPEAEARAHPEVGPCVRDIFERYKNEGSVSRGTRNIAPNLFIGSARQGFFNYSRSNNLILAYTYTGPEEHFAVLARELYEHCTARNLELNILWAQDIAAVGEIPFSSTPFGALQRVVDLQSFTLQGAAMRRLRYQVSKFEKSGACRTEEYRCGTNPEIARGIAAVIDEWCAGKTMVNPLIHIVKEEILAGTLDPEHRMFLTYVDEVLQNVILISPLASQSRGYLMDLEFYAKDMPLGGLEFAIVRIIELLMAEGCDVLSLGGTYGCKLQESANADPQVDKILDELRMQNIFNDAGNLQFKSKFRPENQTIFLCRPTGKCTPDSVLDIIMMIADPARMQTSDQENHGLTPPSTTAATVERASSIERAAVERVGAGEVAVTSGAGEAVAESMVIADNERSGMLAEHDFNPMLVPSAQVAFDLKTDSWAQLQMPAIASHTRNLYAQLQQPANLEKCLKQIFPHACFALTKSGRSAERVFYRAWPKKGVVPQNLLFPTTLFHQIDQGFTPLELPHPEVFRLDSTALFKGDLDWSALQQQVADHARGTALVCIELSNNAAGGHPVSIRHLRTIKELLADQAIALVIDATRVIENALFAIEHDAEQAGKDVWQVTREILGYADAVVASLAKDFCIPAGLVATNDRQLFETLQALIVEEGCGLDAIDSKLAALTLRNRRYIEVQTLRRKDSVNRLWEALQERGIPVVQPAGGHCVLIDVRQVPEFQGFKHPVASFVAWLYLNTGIRAGAHSVGMQKNTSLNHLVRLAIPLGLKREQIDAIIDRLTELFARKQNIPELVPMQGTADASGSVHARYKLIGFHNLSSALAPKASPSMSSAAPVASPSMQPIQLRNTGTADVAVVGMAGRYHKAKNLNELWQRLLQGTQEMPLARDESRQARNFQAGLLDDEDRFDAGFFRCSAAEAEAMDPGERVFLEVVYEALEDAGYYPEALARNDADRAIGVFVGSAQRSIANRVSHWMNLSGPSLTVDTDCSASLAAIQLACEAIHAGECAAAVVGGVNLWAGANSRHEFHRSSWHGDEQGVRAEGERQGQAEAVGALFLKPLDRAVADRDNIYGVFKSVVVTHGGRADASISLDTHPQSKLILKALERADVDARSIGYIEVDGGGAQSGDATELDALAHAFGKQGVEPRNCAVGSLQFNLGDLQAASGIASVQKILLQMRHRKLLPSLHANSPFRVPPQVEEWQANNVAGARVPRRAAINAIGSAGTNAHIILEEYETSPSFPDTTAREPSARIFPVSARTQEQLKTAVIRLREFLTTTLAREDDVAHTLQLGRQSFDHRVAVVASSREELVGKLTCFLDGTDDADVMSGHVENAGAICQFLELAEKRDFIDLLVQGRDPHRLARLWSDGVIPDWQGLDIGQAGAKISLPTYPFADERYACKARPVLQRESDHVESLIEQPVTLAEINSITALAEDSLADVATLEPLDQGMLTGDIDIPAGKRLGVSIEEKARLFVWQLFAQQRRVSLDDVDDDCHLMDMGITSLDMAEMTQSMKDKLDPDFSPIAFFECTTVRSLYQLLAREYAVAFEKMPMMQLAVVDGEQVPRPGKAKPEKSRPETAIEAEPVQPGLPRKPLHVEDAESELAMPGPGDMPPACEAPMRRVFLTGATGFLGIHVLAEILRTDPDASVYCLVRASNRTHGLQRIVRQAQKYELVLDETRISVLCGDIDQPRLGMPEQDWELCCREAQQIVHASAHVNHIEGYSTFRQSTQGMKEIIRLACSHRLKLIQFISSITGCILKRGEEFSVFEKEDFVAAGEHVWGGYGQSKWVQETLLRRAHAGGVPFVIYRFGELSGATHTGLGQTDDMLHRLLQMRLAVGCREKISSDVLDMLPVDFAARLIVGSGRTPELWNAIVHATHLKPYSLAHLYRRAQNHGLNFNPVTRSQYLAACYQFVRFIYSVNPVNGFVLECVLRDAEGSSRNRKMMDGYFSVIFPFEQDHFRRSLRTLGLALPDWNALLDRYFQRWSEEQCGFLARVFDYQQWSQLDEAQKSAPAARKVATARHAAVEKPRNRSMARQGAQDVALAGEGE